MKLLLDVMGGDNAPHEFIKGAIESLTELEEDTNIILIGDSEKINKYVLENYNKKLEEISDKIKIKHASEEVTNHDIPTEVLKTKKDSSRCIGFDMLKNNEGDALISAGNTGALMVGGLLKVGRIKGVDRPALCAMLPTMDQKGFLLLDVGANTNCKPINFVQFAKMGSFYVEKVHKIENPPVALLNIGEEPEKGNLVAKEAYKLLEAEKDINFKGNIEGRYMFDGNVRVVVTDGFSGNIALKTTEGIGLTLSKMLKEELTASPTRKIAGAMVKLTGADKALKKKMDYSEYGGALLLGTEKPIIKCHGSGMAKDVKIVLKQAEKMVKEEVTEHIKKALSL